MTHATAASKMMDHHNSLKLKKKNFILFWPQHMAAATTKTPEKLPFPLMNNHNSLDAAAAAALSSPKGATPQTAAPSSCAMKKHAAAASTSATDLLMMPAAGYPVRPHR